MRANNLSGISAADLNGIWTATDTNLINVSFEVPQVEICCRLN